MSDKDPKGYYASLGLDSDATDEQIKAFYRRSAMDLHPDRNLERDTTEQFQFLNEAYEVLSDPVARSAYDAAIEEDDPLASQAPAPIRCSRCDKISAQPRIVIFKTVMSFVLVTLRKPKSGIYCSDCAKKESVKASVITWLLGWWGVPWGPVYTVQVLLSNMFGGKHPEIENARMLGYQAYFFYSIGRPEIAYSVAQDALGYANKAARSTHDGQDAKERDTLISNLQTFIDQLGQNPKNRLKDGWGLMHSHFFAQLFVLIAVISACATPVLLSPSFHRMLPNPPMPYSAQVERGSSAQVATPTSTTNTSASTITKPAVPKKPPYVRSKVAPNGKPWPATAGYLVGEPMTHTNGYSEVTVDNSRNDSDVFVKLVSLSGAVARPARQVFIPAYSKFTIKKLSPGDFDVRYRDLNSGALSRSEKLNLTERKTYQGTEYSTIELTLYKVRNGNMATYSLTEDEF